MITGTGPTLGAGTTSVLTGEAVEGMFTENIRPTRAELAGFAETLPITW
jgi:hypothetical protein